MYGYFLIILFFFTNKLYSDKKIDLDPKKYLEKKLYLHNDKIQVKKIVKIKGIDYYMIGNSSGNLLIPKLDKFSVNDIETSRCISENYFDEDSSKVILLGSQLKSENSLSTYANLIINNIQKKCNNSKVDDTNIFEVSPSLEIGIKNKKKNNKSSEKKIFIRDFKSIGIGAEF